MIFIDYLYYQLTNFYNHFEKDGTYKASGIIISTGILCWNLILIIILLDYYFKTNLGPSNKYLLLIYCSPIILFMSLRYLKFTSYEEIAEKVKNYSNTKKTFADILLVVYIFTSFFLFIGLALYIGNIVGPNK
jgi:hypothetical protein